jgi:hypothetical protein
MSKANANAHISLHITASRPNGYLVVQPRNPNGTFASPVPAARTSASDVPLNRLHQGRFGHSRTPSVKDHRLPSIRRRAQYIRFRFECQDLNDEQNFIVFSSFS